MSNPYTPPSADLADQRGEQTYSPSVFSIGGRIGRLRYLAYSMLMCFLVIAIMIPVGIVGAFMGRDNLPAVFVVIALIYIPLLFMSLVFGRRRFNDTNHSGWFLLLMLVPIVSFFAALYLLFAPGSEGHNDFGPAPEKNSTMVVIGAFSPIILIGLLGILAAIAMPAYQDYANRAQQAKAMQEFQDMQQQESEEPAPQEPAPQEPAPQ
jgi:uncharacterized membrane protein YhaH (DUF805 family)